MQWEHMLTNLVAQSLHFGVNAGRLISLLYFLSIFPILLIYGVGIGEDEGGAVSKDYQAPFEFNQKIEKVTTSIVQ